MTGGAWCHGRHNRAGLVSNQDPRIDYDPKEPLNMVSVCGSEKCIAKAISYVAGMTNRTATYYADSEARARRSVAP